MGIFAFNLCFRLHRPIIMGVEKQVLIPGDTLYKVQSGDLVIAKYTMWLYDDSKPDGRGRK